MKRNPTNLELSRFQNPNVKIAVFAVLPVFLLFVGCGSENGEDHTSAGVHQLIVPQDYEDPNGPSVKVEYSVSRATKERRGFVLWLTGGPGADVQQFVPEVEKYASPSEMREHYDYVYFNIRGVGKTATPVGCDEGAAWEACLTKIDSQVMPLRTLTTRNFARDIDRLCGELQCGAWHAIYGQSYGTRLAQEYVRMFPGRVKRVVLDGTLPPKVKFFSEMPLAYKQSLDQLFADCSESPTCRAQLGDATAALARAMERVKQGKIAIAVNSKVVTLSERDLVGVLAFLLREQQFRLAVPKLLRSLNADPPNVELLTKVVNVLTDPALRAQFNETINDIVHCNENFRQEGSIASEAMHDQGGVFAALRDGSEAAKCGPVLRLIPEARSDVVPELVKATVPGCILAGANDPVTPLSWTDAVSTNWTALTKIVLRYEGHVNLSTACGSSLVEQCLADNVAPIETGCAVAATNPYRYDEEGSPVGVTDTTQAASRSVSLTAVRPWRDFTIAP